MNPAEKKSVLYTCITGNYDRLSNHSFIHPDWDYVCFTDNPSIKNNDNLSWQVKQLVFDKLDNVRNNRWHKMHPHILFPEYEKSVYIDANINIISKELFDDIDIAVRDSKKMSFGPHLSRKCVYDELDACLKLEKDDPEIMKKQIDLIRNDGFPENYGLFEGNVIYREHHDEDVIKIMNDWWWWVEYYSRRDQLSLTYVLWKNKYQISPLSEIPYRESEKISVWYNSGHVTKEELDRRKKIFRMLFDKVKKNNTP